MATLVYEYGLQEPFENAGVIGEQIWLAHRYYNDLIEAEHKKRSAVMDALRSFDDIKASMVEYQTAKDEVQKLIDNKADKKLIREAVATRKQASAKVTALKKEHATELKPLYKAINDKALEERKLIRKTCGVYWGTYLHIEAAFDQACEAPTKYAWETSPSFRKWNEYGVISMQLQGGLPGPDIFKENTRVWVDPIDKRAFDKSFPKGFRKKLQYTTLHIRVKSNGRSPVWASWPLYMHRPLPEGAMIKWVKVFRIPWNQRWKYHWKVQFTIVVPDAPVKSGNKAVAVNLGWRLLDRDRGVLRVATWADTEGKTGEVTLDWSFRGRIEKANDLKSIRARNLNKLREQLTEKGVKCGDWGSPKRFYDLAKDEELDSEIRDLLNDWAYRDRHLWWYERGCRRNSLGYRKDVYKNFAAKLAKKYDLIIVEDYSLKQIAESKGPKTPARQRVEGSPSEARQILKNTGTREGCRVVTGGPKGATRKCHHCGHIDEWDASKNIEHTCSQCGKTWDQDINNAKNLLSWGLEADKVKQEPKKPKTMRSTRRRRSNKST